MPPRASPIAVETFDGIDRRGGDFGLRPWQIIAANDLIPIDNGAGVSLRPPYNAGGAISGTTITGAGDVMGPFAVGSKIIGIYDAAFAMPALPDGFTELWPMRAPGYIPSVSPARAWTYVGHVLTGSTLVAMLRWSDGSLHLHVWDGKPGYPTQVCGTGAPWMDLTAAERTYTPRMGSAGNRIWISSPKGDQWFSAIGRPRIWWTKSTDDIGATGYEWTTTVAIGATSVTLTVPYPKAELQDPDRYAGIVVEQMKIEAGATVWKETTYVMALDVAGSFGTTQASTIPAWTEITVPSSEWIAGGELTFRLRVVPPTAGGASRRRVNRAMDLASFKTPRTESWKTVTAQVRLDIRDPSAFPYHNDGAASPVLSPVAPTTAEYEFSEIQIGGRSVKCIKSIALGTAYAAGTSVTWTYGLGDGFSVRIPAFQAAVTGKTVDMPGVYAANIAYVSGQVAGVFVNAKSKAVNFLTNMAKPDDVYVGKVVYNSTYSVITPVPTLTDPGELADASWDEARFAESLANAGDARAGTLPTAQHAGGQASVTMLVSARNRLLVCYADSIQLWAVEGAPISMMQLDKAPWGTGTHPAIRGASAGDMAIIPTTRGLAAVSLAGQLNDRIGGSDMAAALFGPDPALFGTPTVHDMASWPHMAAIVVALTVPGDATPSLWAFIRNSAGASLGWWRWNLPPGTVIRPGSLESAGERLHWHGAGTLRFAQARDPALFGVGYTGSIAFAYQHGGRPTGIKRWMAMDLVCQGLVSVTMKMLSTRTERGLGYITGNSYQRRSVPLMVNDAAMGFSMTLEAMDGLARIDRFEVRATQMGR